MHHYRPPLRDMRFVIEEWLDAAAGWSAMPAFAELDLDTAWQVLEEAGRFASDVLSPINAGGDLEGCRWEDGAVRTPTGFSDAYRAYVEAGWPALACATEDGGQGLPQLLHAAQFEMLTAANHAWMMYAGLAHGGYECLRAHAPQWIKDDYLPKIVSGEWLVTMCLSESVAGSDLGLLRTRAEASADGSYRVTGNKIFISGGEQDLTPNIVHLVLARLPDAPAGTRGISLFLVPKHIPHDSGFAPNAVRCDGIEKKMGIKGSATCVMQFEAAQGWLIGAPHQGLAAMFVMMNAARLHVGLQGVAHAEAAYQNALRYAAERRQMRVPGPRDKQSPADPIILHPPVRRTLLELRAYVEGERALSYWLAQLLDFAEHHPDAATRRESEQIASLLTPVAKAFFSDNGFRLSSAALQLFGGYGYVHDYGIEQTLRDSRIAMIYEGTNEIQAIDLLLRKVLGDRGAVLSMLLERLQQEAALCAGDPRCAQAASGLRDACRALRQATDDIAAQSGGDPELPYRVADEYLRLMGLTLMVYAWARTLRVAVPQAEQDAFYAGKLTTAQYAFDCLLPEIEYRLSLLRVGCQPLAQIELLPD